MSKILITGNQSLNGVNYVNGTTVHIRTKEAEQLVKLSKAIVIR